MELELHGWKVKLAIVALALVVVAVPLGRAVEANKGRAEDWHRRAVVAEESVSGLRVVIEQRSRALNERTVQANRLVSKLDSNGAALRQSKDSVGALTRKQRALASESARIAAEHRTLQTRLAALEPIASKLDACSAGRGGRAGPAPPKPSGTTSPPAARCARARASYEAYVEKLR